MDTEIETLIRLFLTQKNYPCIAAVQSFFKSEYQVGLYQNFGQGTHSYELAQALLQFKEQQKSSHSRFLSFWAVFTDKTDLSEDHFEKQLWQELSFLTSHKEFTGTWDPHFSDNPEDKNFCFSLHGSAFYVLGLHPRSPRLGRRFPYPTLIFNLYDQFRELMHTGDFEPMVQQNRRRELLFQGDLNPMVEKYGENWEAIQFSGRENPPDWQCPFQHGLQPR